MFTEYLVDCFSHIPNGIIVVVLVCMFIYLLSLLLTGPKPGPNPFSVRYVTPPRSLVTDQSARNKVIKQRFKVDKVPADIDTIVIGSGVGGLGTAVLLSRAGQKVLVLEQHDQAGGGCHTFIDKGYEFDTGIHYVGKMGKEFPARILCDQLTGGQLDWAPMNKHFDIVALGNPANAARYSMTSGDETTLLQSIVEKFPEEREAITGFMKILKASQNCFNVGYSLPKLLPKWLMRLLVGTGIYRLVFHKYMKYSQTTIRATLDSLTDNEELKTVLCCLFGDIGVIPNSLSTAIYSKIVYHYMGGAYYPVGGSSEVAFHMVPIIERAGGRVLVVAPVSTILINDRGEAHGVRVKRKSGDVDIFAKRILSDAGLCNTMKSLLPKEIAVRSVLYPLVDSIGPAVSFFSVFVGMKGTSKELHLPASNTWAITGSNIDKLFTKYCSLSLEEAAETEVPLMFISFPSAKDPSWDTRHPGIGKSVALAITLMPYDWFKNWENQRVQHRDDGYIDYKQRIGQQMWQQCEQLFPQLTGKVDYIDVGTPLTNKYYLGQSKGEMYGLDHALNRFLPEVSMHLRPKTDIPGLYLTGQDMLTCGFSAGLSSAVLTASAIINRNLVKDLDNLVIEIQSAKKIN